MPKIEYSCKRKRDFVTFAAIVMFLLICFFELYLIVFLPIQMQRKDAMIHQIKKEKMLRTTDWIRAHIRRAKANSRLQESEIRFVSDNLEPVVLFIHKHSGKLTIEQIDEITAFMIDLDRFVAKWSKKQFTFKEEEFDIKPLLLNLENRLDRAERAGK